MRGQGRKIVTVVWERRYPWEGRQEAERLEVSRERERIGPFVVTDMANLSPTGIVCACCDKQLSILDRAADEHTPSPEELTSAGAVAVPNFGWFCCQECGQAYEAELGVRLQRDATGLIRYHGPGE